MANPKAMMVRRWVGKHYRFTGDSYEIYMQANVVNTDEEDKLFVGCFSITKTPPSGYIINNTALYPKEMKLLEEISKAEFNTVLEEVKVFVDLGTVYYDE